MPASTISNGSPKNTISSGGSIQGCLPKIALKISRVRTELEVLREERAKVNVGCVLSGEPLVPT